MTRLKSDVRDELARAKILLDLAADNLDSAYRGYRAAHQLYAQLSGELARVLDEEIETEAEEKKRPSRVAGAGARSR